MSNQGKHQRRRAPRRGLRRAPRLWIVCAAGIALALLAGLALWRGGILTPRRSGPFDAEDLTAGAWRAGTSGDSLRAKPLASTEEAGTLTWQLEGASLRLTGEPKRLTGARLEGEGWAGPRGLRPGETQAALYRAFPLQTDEEQPENFALLYALRVEDGVPAAPYGVLVPSGPWMRAHLVAPLSADWLRARGLEADAAAFALCDLYVDPDTERIARIEWTLAPTDDLLDELR